MLLGYSRKIRESSERKPKKISPDDTEESNGLPDKGFHVGWCRAKRNPTSEMVLMDYAHSSYGGKRLSQVS
jgi:hypothetical protein